MVKYCNEEEKLKNKKVLVHGGTSGIGIAAIQILKLFNSQIFTTVGNKEKQFCKNLGVENAYLITRNKIFLRR